MRQVPWNLIIYEEFCRLAMLNEKERFIMRTRIMDEMTITQQADALNVSPETVRDMVRDLKDRYDAVQPYSDILPVRKKSKREEYMDTH